MANIAMYDQLLIRRPDCEVTDRRDPWPLRDTRGWWTSSARQDEKTDVPAG